MNPHERVFFIYVYLCIFEEPNTRAGLFEHALAMDPLETSDEQPHGLRVGRGGLCESKRCSRDTYPASYIAKYTGIRR